MVADLRTIGPMHAAPRGGFGAAEAGRIAEVCSDTFPDAQIVCWTASPTEARPGAGWPRGLPRFCGSGFRSGGKR